MVNALKATLLELLGSKKFLILVATVLAAAAAKLGWNVSVDALEPYLALAAAYIVGQGIADHGKEAAKVNALAVIASSDGRAKMAILNGAPKGSARLTLMAVLALVAVAFTAAVAACGPSAREKTITTTISSLDAAGSAFVKFDAQKQHDIVQSSKDKPTADAQLATWRAEQSKVEQLLAAGYRAAAIAEQLDTDVSLSSLLVAALIAGQELHALGVIP